MKRGAAQTSRCEIWTWPRGRRKTAKANRAGVRGFLRSWEVGWEGEKMVVGMERVDRD